jgi:TonB-dependent receptor
VYDDRRAAYFMFELPFTTKLRSVFGARVENYDMRLESRGDTLSGLDETSFLPAITLIYDLNFDMNVRAAYSTTVDRPEFRELAPFQFTEASSLRQIFGNPLLEVATITSFDLRWDWFRGAANLISVSAFYKDLEKPIEQVFIAAASTAYSYQNARDGRIYGVEFDARQRLGSYGLLSNFMLQGNLALINSEVNVIESGTFQPTNLQRPLEGQSSYSVNLGAIYQSGSGATEIGAFYSRFGQRLAAAGGFGVPDIYEQPRNVIDLTFKQQLAGGLGFRVKAANLLNEPYQWLQSANGITQVQREYRVGASFSVGLKYDF